MGLRTFAEGGTFLVLVFLFNYGPVSSGPSKLPDNFPRCKQNDPNFDACLKSAIQKAVPLLGHGIPSLQLLPLDPMEIERATIEQGGNGPVSFKFVITDTLLTGLGLGTATAATANLKDREFNIDFYSPISKLEGNYEMDGKFIFLPLKGKGKFKMAMTGYKSDIKVKADEMRKDGETYWELKSMKIRVREPTNFTVHFDNLFNGNKLLGDATNKALNDNWQGFWEELGPSMEDTFGKMFVQIFNKIFTKVPEKNLF